MLALRGEQFSQREQRGQREGNVLSLLSRISLRQVPAAMVNSEPVSGLREPCGMRAVGAAEERARTLYAVANYATATRLAAWRQGLYRTLKAIKRRALATRQDIETLVIIVSANGAPTHRSSKMRHGTLRAFRAV